MGLHRVEAIKQNIELRRRLWGACVISDRWQVDIHFVPDFQPLFSSALADMSRSNRISLSYGHPYMIDVNDCDARLPSSGDPNDLYMDELVRLSIILGRVMKSIYRSAPLGTSVLFVMLIKNR